MYPAPPIQRPVGRARAACGPPGHDPGGAVGPGLMGSGVTWYDVLGVLPGAEARKIEREYDAKAALLAPGLISGAPPDVVTAVKRARDLLDTARTVLGDPERRRRYDEVSGLRRSGGGLDQRGTGIQAAGLAPAGPGIVDELGGDAAGGLLALAGWLGPRRRRDRRAAVPDFRGLFYRVCLEVATRQGLHVRIVRLTERPMAVDGLVVDQDPRPPSKASRGDTLTVQLWHPPALSRW
jgi:PASTA domain